MVQRKIIYIKELKKELLIIKIILFLYNYFSDSMKKKKFLLVIIGLFLIVLSFIIDKIDSYDKNYSYLNLSEYIVNNHINLLKDEEFFNNNSLKELTNEDLNVLKTIFDLECKNLELNNIKNDNCIKKGKYE